MEKENKKENTLYVDVANEFDYQSLPIDWQLQSMGYFSEYKKPYDYQIDAIKNITKLLKYFYKDLFRYPNRSEYKDYLEAKKKLYNEVHERNKDIEMLGLKSNNKAVSNLLQYYDYTNKDKIKVINFYNFVNRASFWMATGSGKTLVIIKLIELINYLINNKKIPNNDILFLTYRDDLIEQFKEHVEEYNQYNDVKIIIHSLNEYDKVKYWDEFIDRDNINIFVYRSDLISDSTKEKTVSFMDFENNGKWYLILDEAHKGDKEYSKRQVYYSFITRFGFLFNFSATFTDPWDILTTVYNFNLPSFIEKGYGKNIYVSNKDDINKFKEFNEDDKEKIVLKSLILLAAMKKTKEKIDNHMKTINLHIAKEFYHNPLMVIYGNSVNTDKSDLEIIFRVLEKIALTYNINNLTNARNDLIDELKKQQEYISPKNNRFILNEDFIKGIEYKDILKYVFNANTKSNIEVKRISKNDEELILKLKSSDKAFALIKIGDIGKWIKTKLQDYEITESYDNKSNFDKINKDNSEINILLGSRSFYEGWDSNRPNIMMFINIGKKSDSRKYILQSIGRGERIEPIKDKRMRLKSLLDQCEDENTRILNDKLNDWEISLLESLFIFGTNVQNIKEIIESIKFEISKTGIPLELTKNSEIGKHKLFIPVYMTIEKPELKEIPKFYGNFNLIKNYINWLSDERIIYGIYNDYLKPKDILRLNDYLIPENFKIDNSSNTYIQTIHLINHINLTMQSLDRFKVIEDEIIHFKEINVLLDNNDFKKLKEKIDKVMNSENTDEILNELNKRYMNGEISIKQFRSELKKSESSDNENFEKDNYVINIKNLKSHYYIPILIADESKINFINHIIKEDSERKFIDDLEKFIDNNEIINNNISEKNFWFFSKIDQTTDKVYIPYYYKKKNIMEKFYPDFIFWIKKENNYNIVFVDPKSTSFTDYEFKVEGYSKIFKENGKVKKFTTSDGDNLRIYLLLYTEDKNKLSDNYKKYWFDNPGEIFNVGSKDDN